MLPYIIRSDETLAAQHQLNEAVKALNGSLRDGDHPNRVMDFARDVERWSTHLRNHLTTDAAGR